MAQDHKRKRMEAEKKAGVAEKSADREAKRIRVANQKVEAAEKKRERGPAKAKIAI